MKDLIKYYVRRLYLWHIRKHFPHWWMRLHCNTCGKDVFKHKGDYFFLKQEVWNEVVENPYVDTHYILCKRCTERILGRKLKPEDYFVDEDENTQ